MLLAGTLCFSGSIHAELAPIKQNANISQQSGKLTGTVEGDFGPVTGAAVVVKGTTNGTITDLDGNFTLEGISNGATIQVSFVGFVTQEFTYTGQESLFIQLAEDTQKLDEVVVTALGMKRSQKALGYAVTELKGDELKGANTINPVAALQGKIAGVEIGGSDGGMFGSTKIQIRGASTLDKNNQPIYVIDGVILDNGVSDTGDADWDSNINDYGNELKNLNPDDFETVSVLKGAAATALYGSRGLNGAVVITTKSGRKGQGLGISVSQTFGIDHVYKTPNLQNVYGSGILAGAVDYGLKDANGNYYTFDNRQFNYNADGQKSLIGTDSFNARSWGPRFDGSQIENYDHTMTNYSAVKNNYKDVFELGFNSNTNVAVQGGSDKTTYYSSLSYKHANGTLPNNSYERLAFMAKASHDISSKVTILASLSFANSSPKNPQQNVGQYFYEGSYSRAYDTNYFRDKYKGTHGGQASTDYGDEYGNVPGKSLWWNLYENTYEQKETMVRPTLELDAQLTDWLRVKVEGNYNYYYRRNETKELGTGFANAGGKYKMGLYTKEQTNLYTTFTANKTVGDWNFNGFLRGEYYNNFVQDMAAETNGDLIVAGQYFIANSKQNPIIEAKIDATKRMMSIAFQGGVSWRNQVFLDVTGRNDWSSALVYTNRTGNYSYFYPSISGSWLINETFELPSWISLGKVRASWAQVGNDTDAYYINQGYTLKALQLASGSTGYTLEIPTKIYDSDLKPERKNAWEIGLDWRFLNSRINVDATYYKENTKNQIMDIDVPSVSGVKQQLINAGNIQNSGVEIALNTIPFRNKDWEWSLDFTYTKNNSKIISLHENVADYILLDGDPAYGNYRIGAVAQVGGSYGLLLSDSKAKIDEATGLEVLTWNDSRRIAYAQRSGVVEEVGSMVPDFLGSIATGLTWKDLSLRVALDMRFGGYIASYGSRYGTAYGFTESSLAYRDEEFGGVTWTSKFDNITYHDGYVPQGIFADGTTVTTPGGNQVDVSGMTYQQALDAGYVEPVHASAWHFYRNGWSDGVLNDDWFKKLNYIALREITIGYRVPSNIASKIGAKNLHLSLSGRNLGYLLNTMPNKENPESIRGTHASAFRARSFSPYTASYMFTINANF